MDTTRQAETDSGIFLEKQSQFFKTWGLKEYQNSQEAVGFILAVDDVVDLLLKKLSAEQSTYSEELTLQLGSALGCAFAQAFGGVWAFSESSERWVIRFSYPDGSRIDVNVFRKLEKRLTGNQEDSIGYMFEMIKNEYLRQVKALDSK